MRFQKRYENMAVLWIVPPATFLAVYHCFGVLSPEHGSCVFPRNVGLGLQPENYTAQQAGRPPIIFTMARGRSWENIG
jgi:hypothetical protein